MYLECVTTFCPILTSFSRKVVRFQLRIHRGSANCRSEFARLYASADDWTANALASGPCRRPARACRCVLSYVVDHITLMCRPPPWAPRDPFASVAEFTPLADRRQRWCAGSSPGRTGANWPDRSIVPAAARLSGIRAFLLYPMNARVADQLARVRKLFGDPRVADRLRARRGSLEQDKTCHDLP